MRNSIISLFSSQDKGTDFLAQLELVYTAFKEKPMTMKEADVTTGVMRENICWYVRNLKRSGRIAIVGKRKCTVTGYPNVNVYTGNPELFPERNQLRLPFDL